MINKIADIKVSCFRGLILSSTILPGAGLTRVHSGKPYWIIGIAGYGCIAASVLINKKAVSSYNAYVNSYDINESKTLALKNTKGFSIGSSYNPCFKKPMISLSCRF